MNYPGLSPVPSFYQNPYMKPQNNINWVQGEEAAKAYQLPPNSNIILMDSESDRFYIKTCDSVGMCTMKTYSYVENTHPAKEEYATKSDLAEVMNKYEQLVSRIDKQNISKPVQQSSSSTNNELNKK